MWRLKFTDIRSIQDLGDSDFKYANHLSLSPYIAHPLEDIPHDIAV